jgi:hypothetical protein
MTATLAELFDRAPEVPERRVRDALADRRDETDDRDGDDRR